MSLNEAQKKAVSYGEGPCLVLAGPGSGKTFTIAKRIEYLITEYKVRPEEILVITFTKYAAGEMKERFRRVIGKSGLPVTFGTFHGIYYGILKWAYGFSQENLLSEEEKYKLLKECVLRTRWEDNAKSREKEFFLELSEEIGNIKNNCYNIKNYESRRFDAASFRKLYDMYEQEKRRARKIDFEDMLVMCQDLFVKRPDILKKWQQKFRYILVDEFQDINQIQYNVIRMLASPEDNLFVVGDDDQSVYGFRGAKPGIMQEFRRDYRNAAQILLNINYRSTAYIVNGASRVIAHNKYRYKKNVRTEKEGEVPVHVQEVTDPLEESRYIVFKYREYIKEGIPPKQIAVLYRTGSDARVLAETFTEYQIPFYMKEHVEHIFENFTCQDMECYFRLASGQYQRSDMLQIANRPKRYIGRDSLAEGEVSYESLRRFYCDKGWMQRRIDELEQDMEIIKDKTPYAAIQYIRKSIGYDDFLKEYAAYRSLNQEELFSVLDEIQERAGAYRTLHEWLFHVEEYRRILKERTTRKNEEQAVSFLTMHGAKGLEYEAVFIIGGNEGVMPYKKAQTEEEIEEERRLFYVAMTRAKRRLIISYVKEKSGKKKTPSRFIGELLVAV